MASLLTAAFVVVRNAEPPASGPHRVEADTAALFSCSRGEGEPADPSEFDLFLDGLVASLTNGSNFFTFQGLAPPGVRVADDEDPATPPPTTDPETGGTLFTRRIGSAQLGQDNAVEFLDPASVPGAGGNEITFGLRFRNQAGADGDDMGLKRILNQNFGLPDGPGGDITVIGVDVDLAANAAMTALPRGFRGRFEGAFGFTLPDGTPQTAGFRFEINSLAEGAAVPETSSLSFAVTPGADDSQLYQALGLTAEFAGFDGGANQPALGFGLDLAMIEPGPNERDLVAADVGWSAAPRQAAFGFAELCPTRGQVAWNLDPDGLPAPDAASLDLDVRLGDQLGQPITVDDGAGGTEEVRASEVVLGGRIDGLPALMDFIMLTDALSFTRSPDVAPDVVVDRFHLAADDPEVDDELPTHVSGEIVDLPRHALFVADLAEETGAVERGDLTSWTLACQGEPAPPGDEAPEDVRRPDRTDTLPFFPAGCARHNLAPLPSAQVVVQNWLPEDLDAQAAAEGLRAPPLDAPQFGYLATRDVNTLSADGLLAFGAKIVGLRRALVDLTDPPPTPDPPGLAAEARVYLERDPAGGPGGPGGDDSARLVVDIEPRDGDRPATRVTAAATIDDLPDAVRIDAASIPGVPVDLTWRADAPFAFRDGTFDTAISVGQRFELHGAFETGAVGEGPLPAAARVRLTRSNSADGSDAVRYTAPEAPDDGFPSPAVPGYDPDAPARLHVGAELSDAEDREADVATRIHADIEVPQPVELIWETEADGRIKRVKGGYICDPGNQSEVVCQGGHYDVSAARGPRGDLSPAALLTRPALPVPTAPVSEAVAPFAEFRPGSGARAVILGPDSWGAELVLDGLSRFLYQREPSVISVQLADTAAQRFGINLLDASKDADTPFGTRPLVLFADAAVDRLPRSIVVRQQDTTAAPDQPWLWLNTQSTGIRDIDDVDWTTDPAGTRPRLTGVLRVGDVVALRNDLPVAERPTGPRSVSGADVWAGYDLDTGQPAIDAVVSLEIPRHVAVWRPTNLYCNGTTDDPDTCEYGPSYELDETNAVTARYQTTSAELGDLNFAGTLRGGLHFEPCGVGCIRPVWDTHWSARARVDHVPGSLQAEVTIADNVRLPWVRVDLDVEANTSVGSLWADVTDHNNRVEYRQNGDPGDAQCTEADDVCTANYAVELQNVPASLRVNGRLQGYAEPRLTPELPPDEPPDPLQPETNIGGLGFVHAQLDLRGNVDRVDVDAREAADGQFVGTLRGFGTGTIGDTPVFLPMPLSGFINARVDHVTVEIPRVGTDQADPFRKYMLDTGGIIGIGLCRLDDDTCEEEEVPGDDPETDPGSVAAAVGRFFSPFVLSLDLVGGLAAELFFEGDVVTDFDLDFDLPLYIGFDRVNTLRVGQNGSTLSVDERHNLTGEPAPDDGDPATISVRQQSMDHEADLRVDGAFYHEREVEFSYDTLIGFEDFDIGSSATDVLGDVGLYRHRDCEDHEFLGCYDVDYGSNTRTLDEVLSDPDERRSGFESADLVLDPVFTPANRQEMEGQGPGQVHPGDIYDEFAKSSLPVTTEAFAMSNISTELVDRQPGFFDTSTYCCNVTTFGQPGNIPPPVEIDYGPVCPVSHPQDVLDGPRAVGSDGTEYVVVRKASDAVPANKDFTFCAATELLLQAHHPRLGDDLGPSRWTIALPIPAGMEEGGVCQEGTGVRCDIEVRVAPQAGGSVHVEMTTEAFTGGVSVLDLRTTVVNVYRPNGETDGHGKALALPWCCGEPDVFQGDRTELDPVLAWVDASGHPGFHRTEAARVDDLSEVIVPIDQTTGNAELVPCTIAPEFGCGPLPEGHTWQWLYGDGNMSAKLSGAPAGGIYRYPRGTPNPDIFLGMLVHYDEDGEVVETAQFRPAGA